VVYCLNNQDGNLGSEAVIINCVFFYTGMTAGAIGSFIGTPAEISLIRMTSDGRSAKSPLK